MKVLGQLEGAQLEQIAATTTTPAPTGRMYLDISNPLAAIPRIFNGSSWLPLLTGTPGSAPVSQNSGKACTVNWATGLFQQVVLTDNCVISFSNPVPGQTHTLLVQQAPYVANTVQYVYNFNMIDQAVRRTNYQPWTTPANNNGQLHSWYYSTAIEPGYATVPQIVSTPNASFLAAAGIAAFVYCSPDGKTVGMSSANTPFGGHHQIVETPRQPHFGPYVGNIAWAGVTSAFAYGAEGYALFAASNTSPFIQARPTGVYYQAGGGQGFSYVGSWANPATLPAGTGLSLAAHPLGGWVVIGHQTSPFMSAYPYSPAGFGAKIGNPATLPAAMVSACAFSSQGDYLAVASTVSPFIQVYPWLIAAGLTATFGTIAANPGTLPAAGVNAAGGKQIAWRPQGDYIAMIMSTSPYLYIVAFNRSTGTFGTAVTINYTPPAALLGLAWTPDGQYLVCACGSAPYSIVLDFSAQTIGASAVALDGAGLGQAANDVVVAPHGEWAAFALNASPFIGTIALPTKARNYLKLNS